LNSHAVAGHALTPEKSANHPFVSGQGPSRTSNNKPPPPATIAQIQPAKNARRGTALRNVIAARTVQSLPMFRGVDEARGVVLGNGFGLAPVLDPQ
jgi:hypothetical protein